MRYRDWVRAHPEWPPRIADVVGRTVRVRRPLESRGGIVFGVGERYRVGGVWRGTLDLEYASGRTAMRRVSVRDVELCRD